MQMSIHIGSSNTLATKYACFFYSTFGMIVIVKIFFRVFWSCVITAIWSVSFWCPYFAFGLLLCVVHAYISICNYSLNPFLIRMVCACFFWGRGGLGQRLRGFFFYAVDVVVVVVVVERDRQHSKAREPPVLAGQGHLLHSGDLELFFSSVAVSDQFVFWG